MRIARYGEHLVQLQAWGLFNCTLVREPDGWTLVDALRPGQAKAILRAVDALGGEIRRIVATHAHLDHVGSLDALAAALPAAEVALGARKARILAGDLSLQTGEPETPLRGYAHLQRAADRLLEDGDRVGHLRVIACPGHTPGHTAFLDTRDGALLAGDALFTRGGLAVAGTMRLRFCLPSLATWDRSLALASGRRLAALEPSCIASGHGPVIEVSRDDLWKALARLEKQLAH